MQKPAYTHQSDLETHTKSPQSIPSFALVTHLGNCTVKYFTDKKLAMKVADYMEQHQQRCKEAVVCGLYTYRYCSLMTMACGGRKADEVGEDTETTEPRHTLHVSAHADIFLWFLGLVLLLPMNRA